MHHHIAIRVRSLLLLGFASLLILGCGSNRPVEQPPVVEAPVCEPELIVEEKEVFINRLSVDVATELKRIAFIAGDGYFSEAQRDYEALLAQQHGLHADAFALWGLANVFLNRENPDYSRENAKTVYDALVSRVDRAETNLPAEEMQLIVAAVKMLIAADKSKDLVVAENASLRKELSNRDEAIGRLRELTVGQ